MNLREFMGEFFSEGELRALCFDLSVDYERIQRHTKDETIIALIHYFRRRDRLEDLINAIQVERPHAYAHHQPILPNETLREKLTFANNRYLTGALTILFIFIAFGLILLLDTDIPRQRLFPTITKSIGSESTRDLALLTVVPIDARDQNLSSAVSTPNIVESSKELTVTMATPTPQPIYSGPTIEESKFGIILAEFTLGTDRSESNQGKESRDLFLEALEGELVLQRNLTNKISLLTAGPVRTLEEARSVGELANADLVLWGWIPEYENNIVVPNFTIVDQQLLRETDPFVESFNLMISGSNTIRMTQLSGRITTLSRFVLGIVYLRGNTESDYQGALSMFESGIEDLEAYRDELGFLIENADTLEQRVSFQEILDTLPSTLAIFYTAKGVSHAALGQEQEALSSYETAVIHDSEYPQVHAVLGNYYYSQYRFQDAIEAFDTSLALDNTNPSTYYGLGIVHFELGQQAKLNDLDASKTYYEAALEYLYNAVELAEGYDEEFPIAYLAIGYTLNALERFDEAIIVLKSILESDSADDDIRQVSRTEIENIKRIQGTPEPESATVIATPTAILTIAPYPPVATKNPSIATSVTSVLVSPSGGVTLQNPIMLDWIGVLQPGEAFRVTLYHFVNGNQIHSDLLTNSEWSVDIPAEQVGEWRWFVEIVQGISVVNQSTESMFWFNPFANSDNAPPATLLPTPDLAFTPTLLPTPQFTATYPPPIVTSTYPPP